MPQLLEYSIFHVISYQRRLSFMKNDFFSRGCSTPLGNVVDWWAGAPAVCSRTEAYWICMCMLTCTRQRQPRIEQKRKAEERSTLTS